MARSITFNRTSVEADIERACRNLPLADGVEDLIPLIVKRFADWAENSVGKSGHVPVAFQVTGKKATHAEIGLMVSLSVKLKQSINLLPLEVREPLIKMEGVSSIRHDFPMKLEVLAQRAEQAGLAKRHQGLAKWARKLAGTIENLHKPAVVALADYHLHANMAGKQSPSLVEVIDRIAKIPMDYLPPSVPEIMNEEIVGLGRKSNARAAAQGLLLGHVYFMLTGRKPTISTYPDTSKRYGPWHTFLTEMFDAMGITGAGDQVYRKIVRKIKGQNIPLVFY